MNIYSINNRQYLFKVYCMLENVHDFQYKLLCFSHCHIGKNAVIFCYTDEVGHYGSEVNYLAQVHINTKNDRLKTGTCILTIEYMVFTLPY